MSRAPTRILFVRDAVSTSPAHFLQRALEDLGVDVCPIYVDRLRRTYQVASKLPGARRWFPGYYFAQSLPPLRNWGQFDLVLVMDWIQVPQSLMDMGNKSALWAIDASPRDDPVYDARLRYSRLPSFDFMFGGAPRLEPWMREQFPRSKVATLPLAAPRHLYDQFQSERPVPAGFVGSIKSGRRAEFLRLMQSEIDGFFLSDPSKFFPASDYARTMRSFRVSVNLVFDPSLNNRVFESLAGGCLLVTDWTSDFTEVIGAELCREGVFTFREMRESPELVRRALERSRVDPDVHRRIHRLAMGQHTYHQRAESLLSLVGLPA